MLYRVWVISVIVTTVRKIKIIVALCFEAKCVGGGEKSKPLVHLLSFIEKKNKIPAVIIKKLKPQLSTIGLAFSQVLPKFMCLFDYFKRDVTSQSGLTVSELI